MEEHKRGKIWLYAVILFTSAFIVLLFTGYSQIKLNRSLDNYKNQVSSKETEKNKYMQNFASAQEMNTKLNEEIDKLENEIASLNSEIDDLKYEISSKEELQTKKDTAISALSSALSIYLNENAVESAGILKNIDIATLEGSSLEAYYTLSSKVFKEAGKKLFDDGYSLYNKGKYSEAVSDLLLSTQYAPSESFSDKCIFYLAYSERKIGNIEVAVEQMNKLINNYPSSKYLRSAKRFVNKYQGEKP